MYVTEIKEKQIFKRIQVATPHSFKYLFFFYFCHILKIYSWPLQNLKFPYELHNAYLIQYKYRYIHKQMCQQCTNDHAI